MAKILTSAAVITCSHSGTVTVTASQQVLFVGGQPALVSSDLDGAPIADDCLNKDPNQGQKPCTATAAATAGLATKLNVGGKAVLLENATGTTDSTPPGTWTVKSAGQALLEAT